MPNIYFVRGGRLGNNIIQYMAAKIICKVFGHTLVEYKCMLKNPYVITDTNEGAYSFSWDWFRESVIEESGWLLNHPLAHRDIYLDGYFQSDDIYLHFRPFLRSLFTTENTDLLRYGVRICDLMKAQGVATEGTVLHLRLDDFQAAKQVLNPRVYLERLRLRNQNEPLTIVMQKPTKQEEEVYVAMFDSLRPTLISSTALEDHATLRRAKRLMTSNSTFAWTAAFLGDAEERFIAPLRESLQKMGRITASDVLLHIEYLDISTYKFPETPTPFSGEELQGLCEYTVVNKEKKEYHRGLDDIVTPDRQLHLEEEWSAPKTAHTIAVYADLVAESVKRVCAHFESVTLLIIHNGDREPTEADMMPFLEAYPRAHIYAQNNVVSHPRIHSLPMGIQNRMWREAKVEPVFPLEKKNLVLASHFGTTHPIRAVLMKSLRENPFDGLFMPPKCSQEDYLWYSSESMYSLCPPGNAHDTHRLWESLYCSARPIVLSTPFIDRLLETCPNLPLVIVKEFETLEAPPPLKDEKTTYSFYLYIEYWRELFRTYTSLSTNEPPPCLR